MHTMLIVHGGWLDHYLLIWGEQPPAAGTRRHPSLRKPAAPPPAHPSAVRTTTLKHLLSAVGLLRDLEAQRPRRAIAWLPTVKGLPLPSCLDNDALLLDQESITQAPWIVSTLRLDMTAAVALLRRCIGRESLASDLYLGHDLRAWAQVLGLAGSLVARQRFLPGLRADPHGYHAVWEPLISGEDRRHLVHLAATLPGACRALSQDAETPPRTPAAELLNLFLADVVDRLVRLAGPLPLKEPPDVFYFWNRSAGSIHDRWLAALGTPNGSLAGRPDELQAFAAQVQDWQSRLDLYQPVRFRCGVRLEEPPADEDGVEGPSAQRWSLRYFLQSIDDPSLVISAADLWSAQATHLTPPGTSLALLRLALLAGLHQGASWCPSIAQSLEQTTPSSAALDLLDAFTFLTETTSALEKVGWVVWLPSWWVGSDVKRRLTLRARVRSPQLSASTLSARRLITFDWQVALGGAAISHEELQALARLKAPLVRLRGQWVQVSAEEIKAALDFWKKRSRAPATLGEVARLALDEQANMGGIEVEQVELEGWIAESLGRLRQGQAVFEEIAPPVELRATLRPYQQRGYAWLRFLSRWGLGACLADDMGLGKTLQALALIQHDWSLQAHQPVLLICPTSVVGNWKREAERFTPDLPLLIHHGGDRRKDESFAQEAAQAAIVISSYALLYRDLEVLNTVAWRGVILDEAQNIKNPETKQAQAARALRGGYRLALTGTPVENSVGDLWSLMEFLNPGLLGSAASFKNAFALPIQARQETAAMTRLKRLTGPFLLRRVKTDPNVIADLPEKLEMTVFCTLTKEQASLYSAVLQQMEEQLAQAEGMQRRGIILATLTRLKQVCNHPTHFLGDHSPLAGRSGKLARLEAMLEEAVAEGDCALIFTQFAEMGGLLQRHLGDALGREVLFLHGQVPQAHRDRMIERFQQSDAGPPLFILSLKAGGLGLNLTRANHVFHFDRWWNPAVENQATDRAFRIGQTQRVQVHKFVCVGTLEERIAELIEGKKELAATVVGTGEGWLTELSTEQLRDLFALRAEAVED